MGQQGQIDQTRRRKVLVRRYWGRTAVLMGATAAFVAFFNDIRTVGCGVASYAGVQKSLPFCGKTEAQKADDEALLKGIDAIVAKRLAEAGIGGQASGADTQAADSAREAAREIIQDANSEQDRGLKLIGEGKIDEGLALLEADAGKAQAETVKSGARSPGWPSL